MYSYPSNNCSSCMVSTNHELIKENKFGRNVYRCQECSAATWVCSIPTCENMARAGEGTKDAMCAIHNGTAASFGIFRQRINSLGRYDLKYERDGINLSRMLPRDDTFTIHERLGPGREGVILVNGFLQEGTATIDEWKTSLHSRFRDYSFFLVDWKANQKFDVAADIVRFLILVPLAITSLLTNNAWSRAQRNARAAGTRLADAIASTHGWRYTLAGHSLGALVIHYALLELASRKLNCVDDVYLLGGAVDGQESQKGSWDKAILAVDGKIYNCFSIHDKVLQWLYQTTHFGRSSPAGLKGIQTGSQRITNVDCSDCVPGHTEWKSNLKSVLKKIYCSQ